VLLAGVASIEFSIDSGINLPLQRQLDFNKSDELTALRTIAWVAATR